MLAVDGPSGTGKGTLCMTLAERLGWRLLDSGALYRLVAAVALEESLDPERENIIASRAATVIPEFRWPEDLGGELQI